MTLRHRLMHHSYRLLVKWARYLHVYLTLFGFALLLFFAVTGFMLNHEDMFLQQKQEGVVPVELLASPEDAKDSIVSKLREEFGIEGDLETFDVVKDINEIRAVFKTPEASISATIQQGDGKTKVQREKELITKGNLPMDLLEPWDKGKELLIVEKLRSDYFVHGKMTQFEKSKESESIRVVFKAPGGYLATATIQEKDGDLIVTQKTTGLMGLFMDLHRGKDSGEEWSLIIDGVSILFVIVAITGLILWTSLRPAPSMAWPSWRSAWGWDWRSTFSMCLDDRDCLWSLSIRIWAWAFVLHGPRGFLLFILGLVPRVRCAKSVINNGQCYDISNEGQRRVHTDSYHCRNDSKGSHIKAHYRPIPSALHSAKWFADQSVRSYEALIAVPLVL